MTSEMAFDCLFVSKDPGLFKTLARTIRDLSIAVHLCLTPAKALELLDQGSSDLVVIDWEGEESEDLLSRIWTSRNRKKPTVVAVSSSELHPGGVQIVLSKPITAETAAKCFQDAYSMMLVEHRRHSRHALMVPVTARIDDGREEPVTICDIGDGGVGLHIKHMFQIGHLLSFQLPLPGAGREILIEARLLWTRDYGRAGCEFVRVPPVDLMVLHEWLKSKSQVKKPREFQ
jgi:PilZ domain